MRRPTEPPSYAREKVQDLCPIAAAHHCCGNTWQKFVRGQAFPKVPVGCAPPAQCQSCVVNQIVGHDLETLQVAGQHQIGGDVGDDALLRFMAVLQPLRQLFRQIHRAHLQLEFPLNQSVSLNTTIKNVFDGAHRSTDITGCAAIVRAGADGHINDGQGGLQFMHQHAEQLGLVLPALLFNGQLLSREKQVVGFFGPQIRQLARAKDQQGGHKTARDQAIKQNAIEGKQRSA